MPLLSPSASPTVEEAISTRETPSSPIPIAKQPRPSQLATRPSDFFDEALIANAPALLDLGTFIKIVARAQKTFLPSSFLLTRGNLELTHRYARQAFPYLVQEAKELRLRQKRVSASRIGHDSLPFSLQLVTDATYHPTHIFVLLNRSDAGKVGAGALKTAKLAINLMKGDPAPLYVLTTTTEDPVTSTDSHSSSIRCFTNGHAMMLCLSQKIKGVLSPVSECSTRVSCKGDTELRKHFYFTPHFNGGNLHRFLGKERSSEVKEQIALEILRTASELHELGVFHGDVKPDNVLIHKDPKSTPWRVALTDFDYAQQVLNRNEPLDPQQFLKGTLGFFPPEIGESLWDPIERQALPLTLDLLQKQECFSTGLTLGWLLDASFLYNPSFKDPTDPSATFVCRERILYWSKTKNNQLSFGAAVRSTWESCYTAGEHFLLPPDRDSFLYPIWELLHPNPRQRIDAKTALEKCAQLSTAQQEKFLTSETP